MKKASDNGMMRVKAILERKVTYSRTQFPIHRHFCFAIGFLLFGATSVHAHGPAVSAKAEAFNEHKNNRKIQFPDVGEYKTLAVDLHTHSVFSDGHVWPKIRVDEAVKDGLDALAITEHLEWQPHLHDIPHPDRNRAIEIAEEAAVDSDVIIIRGSEITRQAPAGHINAVFIEDANQLLKVDNAPIDRKDTIAFYTEANVWPAQEAVDAANQQGAFVFWNHPYWTPQNPDGIAQMNDFHEPNIRAKKLHGIEIANGNTYSEEAHAIALEHDLALIGVSDVHDLIDWDYDPNNGGHRPVTLVLAKEKSAKSIQKALFKNRTIVWFKNLLIGRKAEIKDLLAACLTIEDGSYQENTQVLKTAINNTSDADFILRNTSEYTFMEHSDRITIPAHSRVELTVKPGQIMQSVALSFVVENALIAPKVNPQITLTASPKLTLRK